MSLVFCDGFDHYDGTSGSPNLNNKYTSTSSANSWNGPGRNGYGYYAELSLYAGNRLSHLLPSTQTHCIFGFAFKPSVPYYFNGDIYQLLDSSGTTIFALYANSTYNRIDAYTYQYGGGTYIGSTPNGSCYQTAWNYVEGDVVLNNAGAGSLNIYINSVLQFSATGVSTAYNGNPASYGSMLAQTNNECYYDDYYFLNPASTPNNTPLGEIEIVPIYPNGAGRVTQWTPLSGSNYANVNIVPPPGDSDYVYTGTAGNTDCYTLTLPGSTVPVTSVLAVQLLIGVRKDDTSGHTIKFGFGNGTTETYGSTSAALSSSYNFLIAPYDLNPLTSSAWAVADFSTLQAAIQLVT